jgi:dsDNA-specific endonuclease/ATPase MutS2
MDFKSLWIGDLVWVESLGDNAKWEGKWDVYTAQVRYRGRFVEVPLKEIQPEREPEPLPTQSLPKKKTHTPFSLEDEPKSIDLHIEVLEPRLQNERAEVILEFQLRACRKFIERAIERKRPKVTIIHGKGEGVLKLEVDHLLRDYPEYNYAIPVNNGGASEVWFVYK